MQEKIKVIYILGHSRSGSTVLGFQLGALKNTFFAGEIKKYGSRIFTRKCTCGKHTSDCEFWSKFIRTNKDYITSNHRNDNILRKAFSNLKYILYSPSKTKINKEYELIANLYQAVNADVEECRYIIDSSKSLNRLFILKSIPEIEVYPIYLTRDLRHNLASFVKRKQHMILNYLRLRVNDKLINWYLKNRSDDHLRVSYEELINDQEGITKKICSFAGLNECVRKPLNKNNYHVVTGSSNTRRTYRENPMVELSNRNTDEPFSPSQKRILSLLGL